MATEDAAAAVATTAALDLRNPIKHSKISAKERSAREGKILEKWTDMG